MMRYFIPIFMGLLNIVTSRTERIDFGNLGISDSINRDHWNEILSQSDDMNAATTHYPGLRAFVEHRDKNDPKSEKIYPVDWNKPEMKFDPDLLNLRKMIELDNIYDNAYYNFDERTNSNDELTESDLNHMSTFLTTLLQQPAWEAPLVIVNETPFSQEPEETELESSDEAEVRPNVSKRSRYYRRYPWKRQNSRFENSYDYEAAHFCMPTRDDVLKLLGALHEIRQGNKSRNVRFCNRRRTARTLLTHIRFLGRRK